MAQNLSCAYKYTIDINTQKNTRPRVRIENPIDHTFVGANTLQKTFQERRECKIIKIERKRDLACCVAIVENKIFYSLFFHRFFPLAFSPKAKLSRRCCYKNLKNNWRVESIGTA